MVDTDFLDDHVHPNSMNLPTHLSLEFLMPEFDPALCVQSSESLSPQSNATAPHHSQSPSGGPSEIWNMNINMDAFWDEYVKHTTSTAIEAALPSHQDDTLPDTYHLMGTADDEADRIEVHFAQYTCHALSIQEESESNPWEIMIWPLAKQYPALWHALAGLTYFSMVKQQPKSHADGQKHIKISTDLVSSNTQDSNTSSEAIIATDIVLAFAETWDHEYSPSTPTSHVHNAGKLITQLLEKRPATLLTPEEQPLVQFLHNTWLYLDVLSSFTSPFAPESDPSPTIPFHNHDPTTLNPLLGYSTTFFPTIRSVSSLIAKVRLRSSPLNSPALISSALSLAHTISSWTPPLALETLDSPTQNMTDAIQTAEAYRWAALCLLYQAVPELPNLTSYGELAQKILVYLATVPVTSRTVKVHVLPLLVAGCDAVEDEDREFVRERWKAMGGWNNDNERDVDGSGISSIAQRCLRVTEEVWRRREEYLWARGLAASHNRLQVQVQVKSPGWRSPALPQATRSRDATEAGMATKSASDPGMGTGMGAGEREKDRTTSSSLTNSFPMSAAFKKGVDTLTRSGCVEYTVRGRLHWLGVMKDWDWHVILG